MTHWMVRVAARAGYERVDELDLSEEVSVSDAWTETSAVCGVTPEALAAAVGAFFHMELADLDSAQPTATGLLPGSMARKFGLFPLEDADRHLRVATSDPSDSLAAQEVGFVSGRSPEFLVAPPEAIAGAIEDAYSADVAAASLLARVGDLVDASGEIDFESETGPESVAEMDTAAPPIVKLANIVLHEAIRQRASDIHIQPTAGHGIVRFRVDGVLRTGMQVPLPLLGRIISRIKIIGDLDITDRLRPQDGRARIVVDGAKYDLRISTVPTGRAEKAVIRILSTQGWGTLEQVGIAPGDLEKMHAVLSNRDGIFIVTGPTGSGKTTTLYGALREISTDDVNIMTVEDPVEYELPGLTQIQVEQKQGMTFASALRAILRQDPDVIFVGEIRDQETAEIAAQASLTGHLVLATLHTNDAVGSIRRFVDLGLDPGTVGETLRGALAQRLVRKVCPNCADPVSGPLTPPEESLAARFGLGPVVRAVGCELCGGQGYLGRLPVTEYMSVTPDLVRLVLDGASPFELQEQAIRDGMRTLLESALERVQAGETTLEEVERVIGGSEPAAGPSDDGASAGAADVHPATLPVSEHNGQAVEVRPAAEASQPAAQPAQTSQPVAQPAQTSQPAAQTAQTGQPPAQTSQPAAQPAQTGQPALA